MKYSYEAVKYDKNLPALILMQDEPGLKSRTKLHWHKEIELVYMIEGQLNITINGRKTVLKKGQVSLCNSEEIHIVDVDDEERFNRFMVLMLSYNYLKSYDVPIDSIYFDISENPLAQSKIAEYMDNLANIVQQENDEFIDLKKNIEILKIYYILLSKCKFYKKNEYVGKTGKNFKYVKTAIEYIDSNYTDEITLTDMAQLVGLSPAYFSKYFKNVTDISFTGYLNGVRLEHAIQDMLTRNLSVTDAAFENGFPNVKSFIAMCKKVYGCTPAKYKKQHCQR